MDDALFLLLESQMLLTVLITVLTELKEGLAQLMLCSIMWWSLSFTLILTLTSYWWTFLIPFVIGWLYFLRVITQIFDSNKLKELVVRAYG
jgi:hypothetical protein